MADDFNFNFDDSDSFGFSDDSQNTQGGFGGNNAGAQSDSSNEFGDFIQDNDGDAQMADEPTQDKSTLIKMSIILIVIAIMIIAIIFKVVGGAGKNKDKDRENNQSNSSQSEQVQNTPSQTALNSNQNNNGWIEISANQGVTFNKNNIVSSRFQITDIKHYAKVVDGNSNLELKTVLTGTLDGINGTFEMEVPYSRGCQLSVGWDFPVSVEMGDYNGKLVVGEIFIGD